MKFGQRIPSLKKRISGRTSIKRQVVHRVGIKMPKGYGWIRNSKKFIYNKVLSFEETACSFYTLMQRGGRWDFPSAEL